MKLRVLALALAILAFFMFVGSPFQQAANAIVGVDDAIIAIVIAALAALGITFVTTGAYRSLNEYVADLMEQYATQQNTTVISQMSGVQTGTNSLGKILVNNRFVVYIQGFAAWLKALFNLQNNNTVSVVQAGTTIGDFVSYAMPFQWHMPGYYISSYDYVEYISTKPVYVIITDYRGDDKLWFLSNYSDNKIIINEYHNNQLDRSIVLDLDSYYAVTGFYANWQIYTRTNYSSGFEVYAEQDLINALLGNSGDMSIDKNNIGIDIKTGDITLPFDDDSYSDGDGAVIDVGADWGETYGEVTGVTIPGDYSDGKEGDSSITYDSEESVQDQVEDTPAAQVSSDPEEYKSLGLPDVFPFCIPFDLYNFVACLAADPVAPSFTWRFYVPGICDESIEIDLSEFDAAAQILRTMELLLFCVGLAFVTRKIIRG